MIDRVILINHSVMCQKQVTTARRLLGGGRAPERRALLKVPRGPAAAESVTAGVAGNTAESIIGGVAIAVAGESSLTSVWPI
jgi:hypothetical protein